MKEGLSLSTKTAVFPFTQWHILLDFQSNICVAFIMDELDVLLCHHVRPVTRAGRHEACQPIPDLGDAYIESACRSWIKICNFMNSALLCMLKFRNIHCVDLNLSLPVHSGIQVPLICECVMYLALSCHFPCHPPISLASNLWWLGVVYADPSRRWQYFIWPSAY